MKCEPVVVFVALLATNCLAQQQQLQQLLLPRYEMFPEHILQMELQFKQSAIQEQIQQLQTQYQVNQQNGVEVQSLKVREHNLMQEIQDIVKEMLELQQKIQDRLGGGHQYTITDIKISALPPESVPAPAPAVEPVVSETALPTCFTSNGLTGICRPLVRCLAFYSDEGRAGREACSLLSPGESGVCCPIGETRPAAADDGKTGIIKPPPTPDVPIPEFTEEQLGRSIEAALDRLDERSLLVNNLKMLRVNVKAGSAAAWHQELFPTSNETLAIGEDAQKSVEASVELLNDFKLTPEQGKFGLPKVSILNTVLADTCPKQSFCRPHKYHSTDGSCNNIDHQAWGTPNSALQRLLPPKYDDGVNSPRSLSDSGRPLPSARLVSENFAEERDSPSTNHTILLMNWGQFIDHEVTHTPISRGQSGFGISCCRNGQVIDPKLRHPECFPITLARNDHMFARFSEQCMEFVRSLAAPRPECNFGPREQMNQVTAYLDGSAIYSSSLDAQRGLREFRGGRLLAQQRAGKQFLPANPAECNDEQQDLACFTAGDGRVNEQIELALMHTLWLREHNRIADVLQRDHSWWSDEAVFQEARRIVIAQMQHITYHEFLPILLGQDYMDHFKLSPSDEGFTQLYDLQLNAGITNVFASAAYRFGHTLIQNNIHGYGKFGNIRENLELSKNHFSPFGLYREGQLDDFVRGLTFQSCQNVDRFFSKEITDHLFQGSLNFGLDLIALNIQRGRDHGLPPYNDWREVCGLPRFNTWNDLEDTMDVESITKLSGLYETVNDVDLYVGGIAEKALPGAVLGPTFACLIGDQFARLRRGDRFFYEEGQQPSSFTPSQLAEIRKASAARLLCDNSDNIVVMQPLAFWKPSFLNQRVPCESEAIPKVNLNAWFSEMPAIP